MPSSRRDDLVVDAVVLNAEIYRVGRPPDPWAFSDWAFAGSDGTFGNRWDDAYGRFRVLYASSQRLGAFIETLAPFRPDPHIVAEYALIADDSDETSWPGVVPTAWCRDRVVTKGVATDVRGEFVVVGAVATLAVLRLALAPRLVHHGLADLDASTIRMTVPRRFTQEISSYLEAQVSPKGEAYAGVYYLSRLGDGIENWAIFERQAMDGKTPIMSVEREPIDPDDHDLREALSILGLTLED